MSVRQEIKEKWTKDGRSWYYDVYYYDIYGKRKEKKSKLYSKKSEASIAERDFLNQLDHNNIDGNKFISFEAIYLEWLEYKKHMVKITTYYGIKHRTEKHILAFFKPFRLNNIKVDIINAWLDKMSHNGLKMAYINTIISYLKEILTYAKDNYDFDNKIVNKIHKFKINVSFKKNDSEWNYWTYDEFKTFINNVDDEYYYKMFTFLYYTGLRIGEMIALQWKDIDLEKQTININKTFTNKIESDTYSLIDPKTTNSIRIVDLDNELTSLLKEHYKKESNLYAFSDNMFVFGNVKYAAPTTIARNLNKYINKVQEKDKTFKKITPHGFRHSHVSLLINLGADSRDVAERIGDTARLVEDTYYHMFPNKRNHTINILNNFNKEKNTR